MVTSETPTPKKRFMTCNQTALNLGEPMWLVEVVPEEPIQEHYIVIHGSSQWRIAFVNLCSPGAASYCPCLAAGKEAVRNVIRAQGVCRRRIEKQLWLITKAALVLFIQLCRLNASESIQSALELRVLAHSAVGEEGVSHYLACLASCSISAWPEVRQVVRTAWLTGTAARVSVHYSKVCQSPDVVVEGRAW